MCSESQDTPGRKLVIAVSVGDVSTTRSKFLECGGSTGSQEKQLSSRQQSPDESRVRPGDRASHAHQTFLGL